MALAIATAVGMAACGGSSTASIPPDTVQLYISTLAPTSLSVPVGTNVHFVDEQSGSTHQMCLGDDGTCHSSANGPKSMLAPGFLIQPGQTMDVVFSAAGTFDITCTIHPEMNLTITVQ